MDKFEQIKAEIQQLQKDKKRLQKVLESLLRNSKSVLNAKEVHPRQWRGLSSSISTAREVLNGLEDDQDE